eukprot:CAMPEP_0205922080 /NCGR_PEP_ID=MMETSP1325-20131115/13892_1 /ASSEMBLY_ACC=CAM_ASM_000708 /TAXON_ID=236786 /ORGANISM="Florenciella sp., Strain RCC1007" /LENGTH=149 /DNA_ID=CAMNT_0053290033 /DNA_START=43 /DNA_END=489 /DNA_ORIENTATION=-
MKHLGGDKARAARRLDLLLRKRGEELGLHDHRHLRELALAHDLEVTVLGHVDHRRRARLGVLGRLEHRLRHQRPELLEVHRRLVRAVAKLVEVPHAHLTEVTRVELIKQNAVVVLATGVTAATGVLAVLADTAMAGRHLATRLTVLGEA